ncbi:MAG: response regulator [Desulfobacter sp.]
MDILIIEDNNEVAGLLKAMTRRWGHRARSAATGNGALEIVKTQTFDLILLDIFLPDTIAYELIPKLKAYWAGMQIITMTGNSSKEVEQEVRSQGILYYMVKPVDLDELKCIIEHLAARQYPEVKNGTAIF